MKTNARSVNPSGPSTRITAGVVAVLALAGAFQAAFARQPGTRARAAATQADYGGGSSGDSTGTIVGIVAGGGLLAAASSGAFAGAAAVILAERFDPLPPSRSSITAIRLVPGNATLQAGRSRSFFLEGRSRDDGKWYSLTVRPETSIDVRDGEGCLLKQDGSRNTFLVPLTAPRSCDGKTFLLAGTFAPVGEEPKSATARVRVVVPESAGN